MTALLEKIVSIVAPHHCINCGIEDNTLCDACARDVFIPLNSLCVFCEKPTTDWQLCSKCAKLHALQGVWVAAEYGGTAAELLRQLKFERLRGAHQPLAAALDVILPHFGKDAVIVPLPTAQSRVRQRGYDQSVLIARELARLRGVMFLPVLMREGSSRQTGADRKQRIKQAATLYSLPAADKLEGKNVWLVDDICTTGASLSAAASLIAAAGAKEVNAAVVAWQRFEVKSQLNQKPTTRAGF